MTASSREEWRFTFTDRGKSCRLTPEAIALRRSGLHEVPQPGHYLWLQKTRWRLLALPRVAARARPIDAMKVRQACSQAQPMQRLSQFKSDNSGSDDSHRARQIGPVENVVVDQQPVAQCFAPALRNVRTGTLWCHIRCGCGAATIELASTKGGQLVH